MDDSYFGTGTTNYTNYTKEMNDMKENRDTNYTKEMNDMKGNRDHELHESPEGAEEHRRGNPRDIMIAYHTKALKGRKIITVAFGNVVFRPFRALLLVNPVFVSGVSTPACVLPPLQGCLRAIRVIRRC